jgi:hypothetical protein
MVFRGTVWESEISVGMHECIRKSLNICFVLVFCKSKAYNTRSFGMRITEYNTSQTNEFVLTLVLQCNINAFNIDIITLTRTI